VGCYSQVIFPRLCDFVLDRPFVAKHRRELLSRGRSNFGLATRSHQNDMPSSMRRKCRPDVMQSQTPC